MIREQKRQHRKKMRTLVISILLVIVVIAIAVLILPKNTEASEPIRVVTVRVAVGDSLWKLAEKYDNNTIDLRKYINIIQEFNQLENVTLQPGQLIKIPVYNDGPETIALTSNPIKY